MEREPQQNKSMEFINQLQAFPYDMKYEKKLYDFLACMLNVDGKYVIKFKCSEGIKIKCIGKTYKYRPRWWYSQ